MLQMHLKDKRKESVALLIKMGLQLSKQKETETRQAILQRQVRQLALMQKYGRRWLTHHRNYQNQRELDRQFIKKQLQPGSKGEG